MPSRLRSVALLIAAVLIVAACGASTTSSAPASQAVAASAGTVAEASASAEASAEPSATAEPSAATPEPTPVADPTPAPTPAPWKTFVSTRYKYSVKYPPSWVVTKGSAKLADQIDDYTSHFVFLSRDTVSGVASISLTVTHDTAYYKSHYKGRLASSQKVTVNGWPGRLLTFNGSDNGRKLYIQHLILAKGKVGYIVEMFSDQGAASADKALFKKIYKTFRPRS